MTDGKVDDVRGKAKEAIGDLADDGTLKNEGKVDQAEGSIKDKVDSAADKVKDALKRD